MSQINLEVSKNDPIVLEMGFNFVAPSVGSGGGGQTGHLVPELLNFAQYPNFNLFEVPTSPSHSLLFLNGIKQQFFIDYVVSGSTLNWVGSPIDFVPSTLEFYY